MTIGAAITSWARTMADGVYNSSRKPRTPLRHSTMVTNRPTTTGGKPMPVLTTLMSKPRPVKRERASTVPSGIPQASASRVAVAEMRSESPVTRQQQAHRLEQSLPDQLHGLRDIGVGLAGNGHEERLPELGHAEGLDGRLRLRRHHEVGERLAARRVDARTVGRIDLHNRVDVQERLVLLHEDGQVDALLEGKPSAAIGDGVRATVVGDAERLAHALARLDVPRPLRPDARLLPEPKLQEVGAGLVSAGHEARLRLGNSLESVHGLGRAFDPGGIVLGTDNDEVVVHDEAAILHFAVLDVLPLE